MSDFAEGECFAYVKELESNAIFVVPTTYWDQTSLRMPIKSRLNLKNDDWNEDREFHSKRFFVLERDIKRLAARRGVQQTIKQERSCESWLVELMKGGKPEKPKVDYFEEAIKEFGGNLSRHAFNRAWANAVKETGNTDWSKSGPKSSRRIDLPINS